MNGQSRRGSTAIYSGATGQNRRTTGPERGWIFKQPDARAQARRPLPGAVLCFDINSRHERGASIGWLAGIWSLEVMTAHDLWSNLSTGRAQSDLQQSPSSGIILTLMAGLFAPLSDLKLSRATSKKVIGIEKRPMRKPAIYAPGQRLPS